jgi:hypothetical protein
MQMLQWTKSLLVKCEEDPDGSFARNKQDVLGQSNRSEQAGKKYPSISTSEMVFFIHDQWPFEKASARSIGELDYHVRMLGQCGYVGRGSQ